VSGWMGSGCGGYQVLARPQVRQGSSATVSAQHSGWKADTVDARNHLEPPLRQATPVVSPHREIRVGVARY
jgi:hypothetical protein